MPYISCSVCGRGSVQSLDIDLCTRCISLSDDKIKILAIKKYLEKYPDAKVDEVCRMLNITREKINQFVEQGSIRLIYDKDGIVVPFKDDKEDSEKNKKRRMLISQLANMDRYSSSENNTRSSINNKSEKSKLVTDLEKLKTDRDER